MSAIQALTVASVAGGIGSSYAQANAAKSTAAYEQSVYEGNVRLSKIQAADALRRGEIQAKQIRQQTHKLTGAQRAALAAQGQDLEEDDALAIQQETRELGYEDAQTALNNAWRESWGYEVQAEQSRSKGKFTGLRGSQVYKNTILTGGLQAAKTIGSGYYASTKKSSFSRSDLKELFD